MGVVGIDRRGDLHHFQTRPALLSPRVRRAGTGANQFEDESGVKEKKKSYAKYPNDNRVLFAREPAPVRGGLKIHSTRRPRRFHHRAQGHQRAGRCSRPYR